MATVIRRRATKTFGVSLLKEELPLVDQRVADLATVMGVPITRSTYFAILARHDRAHRIVEQTLVQPPRPAGRRKAA